MASRLWGMYADRQFYKWETTDLHASNLNLRCCLLHWGYPLYFDDVNKCMRRGSLSCVGMQEVQIQDANYTREYWEEHPGEAVPIMRPKFYWGPWRVYRGDELPPNM
ncbi:uncharacterized protein At4g29660 [Zingiber officinale]|uniref:uncharacterized protein At4g29660 n=1 Tax=Zingiber officinale TaxID=94328 RepID=UPI001C4CE465|nr:uncharacterized protein At4g29660 [Zingiber officinale]